VLKDAIAAGDAKVEEARKQFAEAEEQLRRELEEERRLRQQDQERNAELLAVQVSLDQMVKDVDEKALSRCPCLLLTSFPFLAGLFSHQLLLIFSQGSFRIPRSIPRLPPPRPGSMIRLTPTPLDHKASPCGLVLPHLAHEGC
jgi:hypothetical protein